MTKKKLASKRGASRSPTSPVRDPLFVALDAFEILLGQLVRIHAVAAAADEALEAIPYAPPSRRAATDRLFTFVDLTHELATAALASANTAQTRLNNILKRGGHNA